MKYLILFIRSFLTVTCSAQNVMYRGFTNKITPVVSNNSGPVVLSSTSGAHIEKMENENSFIVNPTKGKTIALSYTWTDDVKGVQMSETVEYELRNLPVPEIYWGGLKSGGTGNITAKDLSIAYPCETHLACEFEITGWELSALDKRLSGKGTDLSGAETFLKKVPSGTTLLFTVQVLDASGTTRMKQAQWEVRSWDEEDEND